MTFDLTNIPGELIDFAQIGSISRYIDITHRLTHGAVTIGRLLLRLHSGAMIGATQYTILVQEETPCEMEWSLPNSKKIERTMLKRGDIQIYPSDTMIYERWHSTSRALFMAIDKAFFDQIVNEVFDKCAIILKPRIGIQDPVIAGMAKAWREELHERGAGGRIHAEALAISLSVHLFRIYGERKSNVPVITGGMNGTRLRRVVEYIESNLGDDISLYVLASVAGYSLHHFSEIFKRETGMTPHYFLIRRRIHRARELLLRSDMPIAEIAAEVGFAGQSHLTSHFRKITGTTPMRFRSEK